MIKGFKDFIMHGNVIDLAVAVVIGTAFAKVVDTFVSKIITPILAAVGGSNAADGLGFRILKDNPKTFVNIGDIISSLIVFLITAAVVYFLFVAPMNAYKARRGIVEDTRTEKDLLVEIRDLLAQRRA